MESTALYDYPAIMGADATRRDPGSPTDRNENGGTNRWKKRLAKMGVAGIVFFTVKGLLWLIVPAIAARLIT